MTVAISTNPITDNRLGIVLDDILNDDIGYVAAAGDFGQFDTSAFAVNDVLYSNGSGGLTLTVLGNPIATVLTDSATDGHLFCYVPLPISSGGGGSNGHEVYTYMLTPTDVTNQYITLPLAPVDVADTVLLYEGAATQVYGIDFTVLGSTLTFTGLAGFIASGETITVLFR
jgi:hypothetical protein